MKASHLFDKLKMRAISGACCFVAAACNNKDFQGAHRRTRRPREPLPNYVRAGWRAGKDIIS